MIETDSMELTEFMGERAGYLAKSVMKCCIHDLREVSFILGFAKTIKKDNETRMRYEKEGLHVPAFLISSITTSCNLFCKGCYARSEHICGKPIKTEMSTEDWESVFCQAEKMGISFNILAGGEPMMRREIIQLAAGHANTVFPIFTNGTIIDDEYISLLKKHRNLIPIISLEGGKERTDGRRGPGTYDSIMKLMKSLKKNGVFFGASITVTKENMNEILSENFISELKKSGCGIVFFIEFVAVNKALSDIAPDAESRKIFDANLEKVKESHGSMVFVSFPGDERKMGGCIGAGRGFFHINPYGDAEACPASPHSDVNVMTGSLEDVLRSRLFREIREDRLLSGEHDGGCALLENEDRVLKIIDGRL